MPDRAVHLRAVTDDYEGITAPRLRQRDPLARPACGLSLRRWSSMDVTTTTNPARATCRRPGCRHA